MAYSILIVDDDPDVRALLGGFLSESGFVVHTAHSGRHALNMLAKIARPSLILLDYKMPDMNGSQFVAEQKHDPRLQGIPVVVLSAWTRQWTGAKLEAIEVLSKPVDLDQLRDVVYRVCGILRSAPPTAE